MTTHHLFAPYKTFSSRKVHRKRIKGVSLQAIIKFKGKWKKTYSITTPMRRIS